jgi:hypothetical protein
MRLMMTVKANKDERSRQNAERGAPRMGKYNEELLKAGLLLDLAGMQPSFKGARIKFSGEKRAVVTARSRNQTN